MKKSDIRFRQVNHLCDLVVRHLEPSHALVLLIGWRHANTKNIFTLSVSRLAEYSGFTERHVKNVIKKLIEEKALVVVNKGKGTQATTYKITGKPNETSNSN